MYALSCLYSESKIIVFCNERTESIFKNYDFISEVISIPKIPSDVLGDKKIRVLFRAFSKRKLDVLLMPYGSVRSFRVIAARLAKVPQVIAFVKRKFLTLFSKSFVAPSGYQYLSGHASEFALSFVRQINPQYYDKEISKIDFSQCRLQTSDSNKAVVESFLTSCAGGGAFSRIIGINPFGCNMITFNFSLEDWISLAQSLSQEFPRILFILTTYQTNPIKLEINESQNLKVFCNNAEILNLVELISRLDLFVSVNTGNVHIADNLRIPTLEVIIGEESNLWNGGSYGGEYCAIPLFKDFKENYQGYLERFYQLVRVKIQEME